jgi:ABC-2 type transport system permease protein
MNQLSLIIKREYLTKVKNKSFILMTILTPLIIVAGTTLIGYLAKLTTPSKLFMS